MLIGARQKDGEPYVFEESDFDAVYKEKGDWVASGGALLCSDDLSAFLCRDIPPGEKRVIDLEKSVIVHVLPVKTAVQELVEACERVLGGVSLMEDSAVSKDFRVVGTKAVSDLHFALARVRQEGGV